MFNLLKVDSVKLSISEYTIDHQVHSSKVGSYYIVKGEIENSGYLSHKERETLFKVHITNTGELTLKFECGKILTNSNSNLTGLSSKEDLLEIVTLLQQKLGEVGIYTESILDAKVKRLDLCKDILLTHDPKLYTGMLTKLQHSRLKGGCNYRDGSGSTFRGNTKEIAFYLKYPEMRAKAKEIPRVYTNLNPLRVELRLNNEEAICSAFGKYKDLDESLCFADLADFTRLNEIYVNNMEGFNWHDLTDKTTSLPILASLYNEFKNLDSLILEWATPHFIEEFGLQTINHLLDTSIFKVNKRTIANHKKVLNRRIVNNYLRQEPSLLSELKTKIYS